MKKVNNPNCFSLGKTKNWDLQRYHPFRNNTNTLSFFLTSILTHYYWKSGCLSSEIAIRNRHFRTEVNFVITPFNFKSWLSLRSKIWLSQIFIFAITKIPIVLSLKIVPGFYYNAKMFNQFLNSQLVSLPTRKIPGKILFPSPVRSLEYHSIKTKNFLCLLYKNKKDFSKWGKHRQESKVRKFNVYKPLNKTNHSIYRQYTLTFSNKDRPMDIFLQYLFYKKHKFKWISNRFLSIKKATIGFQKYSQEGVSYKVMVRGRLNQKTKRKQKLGFSYGKLFSQNFSSNLGFSVNCPLLSTVGLKNLKVTIAL